MRFLGACQGMHIQCDQDIFMPNLVCFQQSPWFLLFILTFHKGAIVAPDSL